MAGISSLRIMISLCYLIIFILIIGQYSVESQSVGARVVESERVHLEKLAKKRDLHLEMSLKDDEQEALEPSCTSRAKKMVSKRVSTSYHSPNHRRSKRQVTNNNSAREYSSYGTAASFSGNSESLKYKGSIPLPNHQFSAGVWIQPEGGQNVPVHFWGNIFQLLNVI